MTERGLQTTRPVGLQMPAGMAAVAMLSEEEFTANLQMLESSQQRTRRIQQALMHEGRDYGVIPGTKKPTLYKPGAEILTLAYGLVARIETEFFPGDGVQAPAVRYDAQCFIHVGSWDGPIVAVGYGACNSWEKRYRYITTYGATICPGCGNPGLIKTKARDRRPEQWWHPVDPRGLEPGTGCGENFPADIEPQRVRGEQIENPDPLDLMNTCLKMSEKRAHVDAILRATGTSGLFMVEEEGGDKPKENPDAKSRREFNEWIAEAGLDPVEVMEIGKRMYPDRDLRKITVWERTALRAVCERDLIYGGPPAVAAQATQPPETAPVAQPAAPAPAAAPEGPVAPVETNVAEREAIREAVKSGKSADDVVAEIREREASQPQAETTDPGRLFSADELADLDEEAEPVGSR